MTTTKWVAVIYPEAVTATTWALSPGASQAPVRAREVGCTRLTSHVRGEKDATPTS